MKQYVDYYQAGFVGLTGTDDEIRAAAGAWGVSYAKVEIGLGVGLRHGPHGRHLPGGRGGPAPAPDLVRGRAGDHRRPGQRAGDGGPRDARAGRAAGRDPGRQRPPRTPAAPTPAPSPAGPSPSPATAVRVRLESTVVRAGPNRIVVTVSDPDNRELAKPGRGGLLHVPLDGRSGPGAGGGAGDVHLGRPRRQGGLRGRDDAPPPGRVRRHDHPGRARRPGRVGRLHDGRPRAEPHAADRRAGPQRPHPDRGGRRRQPAADLERRLPRSALLRALRGRAAGRAHGRSSSRSTRRPSAPPPPAGRSCGT